MTELNRIKIYNEIEQYRKRPLIVYITSGRPGAGGNIASDAVREFVDQLKLLPKNTKELDVIINSYGGDGLASWRLISLIREFLGEGGKITSLVPYYAFSAATLFCVGSDEIFLHPMASLGPVDPQITVKNNNGQQRFAYEDLSAYTKFLKEEGGLSEQSEKAPLLEKLVNEIQPSVIGASKRSSLQSKIMAEKLLKLHMTGNESQKAEAIAEKLNKSYFSHGHAVSRTEAIELGLKISDSDEKLESLIWDVFQNFEEEMEMRDAFDPIMHYLSDPASNILLSSPPIISMPGNTPQAAQQQVWQQVLSSIQATNGPTVDFSHFLASVESKNLVAKFLTQGKLFGTRQPDLNFLIGRPVLKAGWEKQLFSKEK